MKRDINRILWSLAVWLMTSVVSAGAAPTNFSFTGNFSHDDDVQLFYFTLGGDATVTLRSYGYGGGTNAAGQVFFAGGFDPILTVFHEDGRVIDDLNGINEPGVPADPTTVIYIGESNPVPFAGDVLFTRMLSAGSYIAALSQVDNLSKWHDNRTPNTTLSDGFVLTGEPNYTGKRCGEPDKSFLWLDCSQRTSFWAFDILNVDYATERKPVSVSEPSTLGLMGVGVLILGALSKRRNRGSKCRYIFRT